MNFNVMSQKSDKVLQKVLKFIISKDGKEITRQEILDLYIRIVKQSNFYYKRKLKLGNKWDFDIVGVQKCKWKDKRDIDKVAVSWFKFQIGGLVISNIVPITPKRLIRKRLAR